MTDEYNIYNRVKKIYPHKVVNHGRREYVWGNVHTNSIEGFWSQLKRSIDGTYHSVSPKHLQKYIDEFVYRYNLRKNEQSIFIDMISKINPLI